MMTGGTTMVSNSRRLARSLQSAYYISTGLWPLLHYRSFEAVSGPKYDRWLVKTLGGLISAVGWSLAVPPTKELRRLGLTSALALGTAEVIYVAQGRISRIYLVDAAVEALIVMLWLRDPPPAARSRRG